MDRRGFLGGMAAGAVGWVAGIPGKSSALAAQAYAHPVPFVPAAASATDRALFAVNAARTALEAAATYPQSVASGDPNPNGAVIWTRVAPQALQKAQTRTPSPGRSPPRPISTATA